MAPTDKMPWDYVPPQRALLALEEAKYKVPKVLELKGVFSYYHQGHFDDSKPTGIRLSACLLAMDELRTEMYDLADMTVSSFEAVRDRIVEYAVELRPSIRSLDKELCGEDGLLYTIPEAKGVILSWLRVEAQLGWPAFPKKTEEQVVYLVGKNKFGPARSTPVGTARFTQDFCNASENPVPLEGDQWEQDFNKFWQNPREKYTSGKLATEKLSQLYPSEGKAFAPRVRKTVTWRMTACFEDLWGSFNHIKVPELLWDVNMQAGRPFTELLKTDTEPQAFAVKIPGLLKLGCFYDIYCFLEEDKQKAVYLFFPKGETQPSSCLLAVCALYKWADVPVDGKTIAKEDLDMLEGDALKQLMLST